MLISFEPTHDHHVGRTRLAGLLGQLVEWDRDATMGGVGGIGCDGGIQEDDSADSNVRPMLLVRLVVERYEDVDRIAGTEHVVVGDASLGPGWAAENLRGEGREREGVVANFGGCPGKHLRCGNDALSAFSCEPNDDLTTAGHPRGPPYRVKRIALSVRRRAGLSTLFSSLIANPAYASI
jgi:hypothetical protein